MWEAVSMRAPLTSATAAAPSTMLCRNTSSALPVAFTKHRLGRKSWIERVFVVVEVKATRREENTPQQHPPALLCRHANPACQPLGRCSRLTTPPMSTGEALATLPTSSSDCIILLMRARSVALALMPLPDIVRPL